MSNVIRVKQFEQESIVVGNTGNDPFVQIADLEVIDGSSVTVTTSGMIYVSDRGRHVIWRLKEGLEPVVFAGELDTPGYVDGESETARFNNPKKIVCDNSGNLYVFDSENHRIRKIDSNGNVSTVTRINDLSREAALTISPDGAIFAVTASAS